MSDKTVDEITRELSKFGSAAVYAFQQWRRANPNATKVPRGVWKQMDLADRDQRWTAKIRLRQQVRAEGEQRKTDREALYKDLETRVGQHRKDMLSWHRNPGASYDQHMRRQWELLRDREQIERVITTSPLFSAAERGQAVRALTAAHQAWRPGAKEVKVRTGPLSGVAVLKARAAERLSRIRLGITERGRTGHRPQPDRPATPKTPQQSREELRHLIAERHEMALNAEVLAERLRERGTDLAHFAGDAEQMATGHQRNLARLDREINDRIIGSGMSYDDWSEVQFQLQVPEAPERQANRRWMERQGQWDLERCYRINSWDGHVDHVLSDDYRRWGHDFPEIEDRQRREFLNPPAGWEPVDPDATDRFMFLLDYEGNPGKSHVRAFGYPSSGYDWVQRKMAWTAEPHIPVSITVWDRAVPLDANNRVRGYAIDSIHGLYANIDGDLDRRYEHFRQLTMDRARDRTIPPELSVPGMEDLGEDRQAPWNSWNSVRASNIGEGDQIHSIGESGRVWTMSEADWFKHHAPHNRAAYEAKFERIGRYAFHEISEESGWSEDIEHVRFALDHNEVLDPEARARAREILAVTETEAKLGQRPDRSLWAAVTDRTEFERWSGLQPPQTPETPESPQRQAMPEPQPGLIGRASATQARLRESRGVPPAPTPDQREAYRQLADQHRQDTDPLLKPPRWSAKDRQRPEQVPYVLDADMRQHFRRNFGDWSNFVQEHVHPDRQGEWLMFRDQILDQHANIERDMDTAWADRDSTVMNNVVAEMDKRFGDNLDKHEWFARWWVNGGSLAYADERRARAVPERPEHGAPQAPETPDRDDAFSDGTPIPEAPEAPDLRDSRQAWDEAVPVAPVVPDDPDSDLDAVRQERDSLREQLHEDNRIADDRRDLKDEIRGLRTRAERAEQDRDTARGQRDEAVAKLVRRTPPEQRYGSPQRRAAAERPEAPEAPEAPEQSDCEELPLDRDEVAEVAYDCPDLIGSVLEAPEFSGVPETLDDPLEMSWGGFDR
ncbi:hypothetical protein [Nocardia sp. NPDC046763]|uniref:hypothetical protein n=1 Tax=Nocardia sp. NPDC046763 TaxID=3155256 RepID=UPI0033E0890A